MTSDRVGDFIIRLQNASRIGTRTVVTPYTAHLAAIAKKLRELGFIASVTTEDGSSEGKKRTYKNLVVTLEYGERGEAKLRGVKRVSKPGRRLYAPYTAAHRVKGGTGARIISSSAGIISDTEARKNRLGGEDLFEIW